jgi:nicotinamidase-related amidase
MAEIHKFETAEQIDRKSVVETLEEVLADARAGNIEAVVVSVVRPKGHATNCTWSTSSAAASAMVGAASFTLHRLMRDLTER